MFSDFIKVNSPVIELIENIDILSEFSLAQSRNLPDGSNWKSLGESPLQEIVSIYFSFPLSEFIWNKLKELFPLSEV